MFYIERPSSYYWLIITIGGGLLIPFIAQWIATLSFICAWESLLQSGAMYSFDLAIIASTLGLYADSTDSDFTHFRVGVIITGIAVMILSMIFLTSIYSDNPPLAFFQVVTLFVTIGIAIYSWGVNYMPKHPEDNSDASAVAMENRKRKELANMKAKSTPDDIDLGRK